MLDEYLSRPLSPWHMPGHKRKALTGEMWDTLFSRDVTEVPGTDDYHHPAGPILLSQREAAAVYGTAFSHYLVGGSTAGILASVLALTELYKKDHADKPVFLVGKNSHRSVFHSLRLSGGDYVLLDPSGDPDYGPVLPAEVNKHLEERTASSLPPFAGCIITSPTYAGAVSPLREIHDILKMKGIPLLVDEAHGAHLPFIKALKGWSAVSSGAELIVQSLHKTLPALTQTGILHVNASGKLKVVLNDLIKEQLSVVQSSSPSYILLSSAEAAVAWASGSEEEFNAYMERLLSFRKKLKASMTRFSLMEYPVFQDPTRITLCLSPEALMKTGCARDTMKRTAEWLENNTGVVIEAFGPEEMILISTVSDSGEDLDHLLQALIRLDKESVGTVPGDSFFREAKKESPRTVPTDSPAKRDIYVYPPGIPIVRKGEIITKEALDRINKELSAGKEVRGIESGESPE